MLQLSELKQTRVYQEGLEQGLEQGARRQLVRILQHRFGEVTTVAQQLEDLDLEQLENLVDVALEVGSLAEFCDRIPKKSS